MKILTIRLKNLNSLMGEWLIDLTHPSYTQEGLFLITGPTGAGKSTLLDAICLALYGCTPRLKNISTTENEIMSRQAHECSAEVTFEINQVVYCATWQQKRTLRSKTKGFADIKHEIVHVAEKRIVSEKSQAKAWVAQTIGLDFKQFTHTMLLAQGEFAKFLQESPSDRSNILEKITGTTIYSDLSKAVFERHKKMKEDKDALEEKIQQKISFSEEEIHQMENNQLTLKQAVDQHADRIKQYELAIQWNHQWENAKTQHQQNEAERHKAEADLLAFQPKQTRLIQAEQALLLESSYRILQLKRQDYEKNNLDLKKIEAQYPIDLANLQTSENKQKEAKVLYQEQQVTYQQQTSEWEEIQAYDHELESIQNKKNEKENEYRLKTKQKDEKLQEQNLISKKLEYLINEQNNLQHQITPEMQKLEVEMPLLRSQCNQIHAIQKDIKNEQTKMKNAEEMYQKFTKQRDEYHQNIDEFEKQKIQCIENEQQNQKALNQHLEGRLLREWRNEWQHAQEKKALWMQIASLEEHRHQLVPHQPCPLCGATEHPYLDHGTPKTNEIDVVIQLLQQRIKTCEHLENQQHEILQKQRDIEQKKYNIQKIYSETNENCIKYKQDMDHAQKQIQNLQIQIHDLYQQINERFLVWGMVLDSVDSTQFLLQLEIHLNKYHESIRQYHELTEWIAKEKNNLLQIDIELLQYNDFIFKIQGEYQKQTQDYQQQQAHRFRKYGLRNVEQEKRIAKTNLDQAHQALEEANLAQQKAKIIYETTKNHQEKALERSQDLAIDLKQHQDQWQIELLKHGFAHETAYLATILSADERQHLKKEWDRLKENQKHYETLTTISFNHLNTIEKEKPLHADDFNLQQHLNHYQEQHGIDFDKYQAITFQLDLHTKQQQEHQSLRRQLDHQREELADWHELNQLIGQADGKKFRKYAQGITMSHLVTYTNQYLATLSPRYQLMNDADEPMDLNVLDKEQDESIRPTKNLSGGEVFIVSLALALGLSKMGSKHFQIGTLFLDEGFGSLDEEALHVALNCLAELQHTGQCVGLISHVGALHERINTQIQVIPEQGGRSRLSGCGVTRIN